MDSAGFCESVFFNVNKNNLDLWVLFTSKNDNATHWIVLSEGETCTHNNTVLTGYYLEIKKIFRLPLNTFSTHQQKW